MTTPVPPPPSGPATAIDQPPVPRSRMSWVMKLYLGLVGAAFTVYLLAGVFGWDQRSSVRDRVPGSVRNSPGGYRAYHFWHAGYHGGK